MKTKKKKKKSDHEQKHLTYTPKIQTLLWKDWIKPATCIHLMYSTVCLIQKTLGLTLMQKPISHMSSIFFFPMEKQTKEVKEINGALFKKKSNIQRQIYIFWNSLVWPASLQDIKLIWGEGNKTNSNDEALSPSDSHRFVSLLFLFYLLFIPEKTRLFPFTGQMVDYAHIISFWVRGGQHGQKIKNDMMLQVMIATILQQLFSIISDEPPFHWFAVSSLHLGL